MTAHKVAFRDSSQNASAKYTLFVDLVPALAEHGSERSSPTTAHSPTAPQPFSPTACQPHCLSATQPLSPVVPQALSSITPQPYLSGSYSTTVLGHL